MLTLLMRWRQGETNDWVQTSQRSCANSDHRFFLSAKAESETKKARRPNSRIAELTELREEATAMMYCQDIRLCVVLLACSQRDMPRDD